MGASWNHTRHIMPEMGIVPEVPGERTVRALSFGDDEAFFRLLALSIQNSGDTFGRFTALYKYDYNKLYHWLHLLDGLDNESDYLPSMASYYFSQTQNIEDEHYIVDYLDEYTEGRAKEKWWWVTQAAYLANHKMHDTDRALKLAERLQGVKGIPIWAQQLPAFIPRAARRIRRGDEHHQDHPRRPQPVLIAGRAQLHEIFHRRAPRENQRGAGRDRPHPGREGRREKSRQARCPGGAAAIRRRRAAEVPRDPDDAGQAGDAGPAGAGHAFALGAPAYCRFRTRAAR
ncbi:MAG: hypothetical protein WDN72_08230 [Alphaproteobacteria bacterium]